MKILIFLFSTLLALSCSVEAKKSKSLKTYVDFFKVWSIDYPSCYQVDVRPAGSTTQGSVSFFNEECPKKLSVFDANPIYLDKKMSVDARVTRRSSAMAFREIDVNGVRGVLFLWPRGPKIKLKEGENVVTWLAEVFCKKGWVKLGFFEGVPASSFNAKRRTTSLKGPSKESMKILNSFKCLK